MFILDDLKNEIFDFTYTVSNEQIINYLFIKNFDLEDFLLKCPKYTKKLNWIIILDSLFKKYKYGNTPLIKSIEKNICNICHLLQKNIIQLENNIDLQNFYTYIRYLPSDYFFEYILDDMYFAEYEIIKTIYYYNSLHLFFIKN